ncbi:hypothetical protein WJM95_17310 [Streptomyces sp. f51]|uniref:hypothetical protein n=1 Tax=Streptomyces sp. f51 TaxID=1827742 RepID=UPI0030CE9E1C
MTSTSTEVEPAPVFVDQTGQRGRRLRGLGWLVGILCAGCVVAMVSGLVGTQSQAPALTVPASADTTPPSQYLNAPLPAAPGAAGNTPATAATSDATASVTGGLPSATATTGAGTAAGSTTDAPATTTAGTAASSPLTATAQ